MYHFQDPTNLLTVYCKAFRDVEEKIILISKPTFPSISLKNISSFCDNSGKDFWQYIVGDLTFNVEKSQITMPCVDYNPKYEVHA